MKTYLITGGAGFVGSSLAIRLKEHHENVRVIAFDNLKRRGAELNLPRLRAFGVEFVHGDVRSPADLEVDAKIDCLLECAAEPSVLAGYDSSPNYVVDSNLSGALNCLELARKQGADIVFFSTSRVYPYSTVNALNYVETTTRYELTDEQVVPGTSSAGVSERFPLEGTRSLYGATKLAAELVLQEYVSMYDMRGVINRCGVLAGPWQMGKVDQGFVTFWVARHFFGGHLRYLGFGGSGKQVRDILHVDDLYRLLEIQMGCLDEISGRIFNVGGGREVSISLRELTALCEQASGRKLDVGSDPETRPADIRIYHSDNGLVHESTGWEPETSVEEVVDNIATWIGDHKESLERVLGS